MDHEFLLISRLVDYRGLSKNPYVIDSVDIPDELIEYMADSLNWIPCKNPAISFTQEETGINYYGVTLFDRTSVPTMKSIFMAWHSLFANSPEKLELTGDFVPSSHKKSLGAYERLVFDRDDVLKLLETLLTMVERIEQENLYIYHLGI